MPSTPSRARLGARPLAMDSPLGDLSHNLASMRVSPSKGGVNGKSSKLFPAPAARDLDDSIPSSGAFAREVTKDWEGAEAGATSVRRKNSAAASVSRGDRYIPNRDFSRSSTSEGLLENGGGESLAPRRSSSSVCSTLSDPTTHQASVAAANVLPTDVANASLGNISLQSALGVEASHRILSFSAAPPPSASSSHSNAEVASRYAATRTKSSLPSSLVAGGKRVIPTNPIRTLDAPNLVDDYYTNLLSWSSTNVLAVPLESAVHLWNADTGDVTMLVDVMEQSERAGGGPDAIVTSCRWTHDGSYLAIATPGGYVQLWDVESGVRMRTLKPSSEGGADCTTIGTMAWTPDGETFSVGYASGLIREHDVRVKDSTIRNLSGAHSGLAVCGMEWRADGALLASGGNDNVVQVWDRRSSVPKMRKENHKAGVRALSWCPWNSSLLASGGGTMDRAIHFWNVTTGSRTQSIQTAAQVTSLHWSLRYRELLSTHGANHDSDRPEGSIAIWSHPGAQRIAHIPEAHRGRIVQTALSPDGQTLATCGSGDEDLKLWNVFEYTDGDKGGVSSGGAVGSSAKSSGGGALTSKSGALRGLR